jgi:putative transposase
LKSPSERLSLVNSTVIELSIVQQCILLSVNRSSFYYVPSSESEENLAIMAFLDKQYYKTPFYGQLKLTQELRRQGYCVNVKRVRRLMELVQWQTIYRTPRTTFSDKTSYKYPYLLKDLAITRCNQVWATDITYIPMKTGFLYLTAVIDLYSRKVLNWSLSNTMSAEWCTKVVQEAVEMYGKPDIFNTDQGVQYTSELFISMLKKNEIQISMDGKGRAIDNIFIERLWRTVKYEDVYLHVYEDGLSLYKGLSAYFDFYNTERTHQSLEYKTPNEVFQLVA